MPFVAAVAKMGLQPGALGADHLSHRRIKSAGFILAPRTLSAVFIAAIALMQQGLLAAWRQIDIVGLLGSQVTMLSSLRVWFAGLFVNQVGLTFIARDVMRGVQFAREGVPRRAAGRAVVLDRIVGLAVLLLMVDAVLPFIATLTDDAAFRYGLLFLGGVSTAGFACLLLAGFTAPLVAKLPIRIVQHRLAEVALDLASVSRFLHAQPKRLLRIATLSVVMHLLNVAGVVLIAQSLGANASSWAMAALTIPVMFLSMLPISIAGWGVREAAMITAFGLLQISAQLALTASVAFGVSAILASLPGILVLSTARRLPAPAPADEPSSIRYSEHSK